jgi:uncharacterized protein DUF4339
MKYFIKRDLNEFGPYTLSDLQRYIASGNIQLTDLARREDQSDWVPVSQVAATFPTQAASTFPSSAHPAAATPGTIYADPPSLHWGIVALLGLFTCGLFGIIWAFVQASFVKKIDPASKAVMYYGIGMALMFAAGGLSAVPQMKEFSSLVNLVGAGFWIYSAFNVRASLLKHYNSVEPIGLVLSPVMTFFFNVYYFQYHFTRMAELKKHRVLGSAAGL